MANWPHPRTQDQSHTLLGKEPFFGHRVVSLCPVSHLCTIPGSWNLSQPGPGLIIPTWQSGIACCPHHQAQGWLQARAFHMGHGCLHTENPSCSLILYRGGLYNYRQHQSEEMKGPGLPGVQMRLREKELKTDFQIADVEYGSRKSSVTSVLCCKTIIERNWISTITYWEWFS